MNKQIAVTEFMERAGQAVPNHPTVPDNDLRDLRLRLIREECDELEVAINQKNLVEIADALADILYVTYGAAAAFGIIIDPVFAEVQRSNMTKFIDGYRRADGKWMKGPSYTPANIAPIIEAQMPVDES